MVHIGFANESDVHEFRDTLKYDKPKGSRFVAEMQERGIRIIGRGLCYISAAHTEEEIDHAVATAREVFKTLL
jgi:glutamate-1-semialdehyde 2,1-aminomutase